MSSLKSDGKTLLIIFIGAIIAATLIASIADQVVGVTTTITVTNATVTAAVVNTTLDVRGRTLLTTVNIINASNETDTLIDLGGSLQTGTGSNGLRSVQLILNDTASDFAGEDVNISYTADPDGYIPTASGRSITILITLFAALATLIFVIVVLLKHGSMGDLIKFKKAR